MSEKPLPGGFLGVRRVLVREANWIGDAVMTLPALASIRKALPDRPLAVLAKPWVADLFSGHPLVDEIILYESPGRHAGLRGKWMLAGELRRRGFDLAVLFPNSFEAALLAFLARIPERAGYGTDGRGFLLTRAVRVSPAAGKGHQVDYYRAMTAGLGFSGDLAVPALELTEERRLESGRILEAKGLDPDGLFLGLAPGAAYGPAKQWFPERFAEVADLFSRDLGARSLLFGSAGDGETARRVMESAGSEAADFTGRTTLGQALGLIARCRVFVTNDSGLMHAAAALGVPVVAVFGSTDPDKTGPRGRKCRVVRRALSCAPCLKKRCPENRECMARITVEEVYEAARDLWHEA